jgi:hypothetical protein
MEVTEEQKQRIAANPRLNEHQKQAISLLQTLSEEEVVEVVGWVLPIIVEVPSTNDIKQMLQARGIDDSNVAAVVGYLMEDMHWVASSVERQLEHAIDKLEKELKQEVATKA